MDADVSDQDGWMPMDAPVHEAFKATGPQGYMEFSDDYRWRMHYPDGTIWYPEEQ